ncbi:MAG: M28 family peptidase [Bacteroidetes bacterium]|nr:MAG: M28 family peptidase [Bacteroidota bacterium]
MTDTLSTPVFSGRGYVGNGMGLAAQFIAQQMQTLGMDVQMQPFTYPVNRFANGMELSINGRLLTPGVHYLVNPGSQSCRASGALTGIDSLLYVNKKQAVAIRMMPSKLTWSVATAQNNFTEFWVKDTTIGKPERFDALVDAEYVPDFSAQNVQGFLRGTAQTDSLLVFTAHYDHLGMMGANTMFAGANDNASGVALMLSLAKHYAANPPRFNMLFLAFGGEEAGLIGSKYYVEHPLVSLKKIRFLINLDLVGNGEEGITVVNATEHKAAFLHLQKLNQQHGWFTAVNGRGKAANSDHYWFSQSGVPAFFIYTLGARKSYHDVDDVAATLRWPEAHDLQQMLLAFANSLMLDCCW